MAKSAKIYQYRRRNFHQEILDLVSTETQGEYNPRDVAKKITEHLRFRDRELMEGWLFLSVEDILHTLILSQERRIRTAVRRRKVPTRAQKFREAVRAHSEGDSTSLHQWLTMPVTTEGGIRKPFGSLTIEDLSFAVSSYQDRADSNKKMADFLRVLRPQIRGTVGDTFSEEGLTEIWNSIV